MQTRWSLPRTYRRETSPLLMVLYRLRTRCRRLLGKHLYPRRMCLWFHHQCEAPRVLHEWKHPLCRSYRLSRQYQPNSPRCPRGCPLVHCHRHHLVVLYLVKELRTRKVSSTMLRRVRFMTRQGCTLVSSRCHLLSLHLQCRHIYQVKWTRWSNIFLVQRTRLLGLVLKICLLTLLLLL